MILFEDRAATVLYKVLKTFDGDKKFLLPLNVCPIVPDTFVKANIKFDFVDINIDTLCMDKNFVLERIKNDISIKGILFVKTFGIDINVQQFFKQIKEINSDIFIIDDMCPCIQEFDYDIENSSADMALFSSGYSKYVDIGYGGYGFLKNEKFNKIFDDKSNTQEFLKYKNKILKQIPLMKNHKKKLNNIYKNGISTDLHLGDKFNNWRFSIMVDNKSEILEKIYEVDGLFAGTNYPQVDFNFVTNPIQNSNVKKIHDKILNLFNDFRFTEEKAYQIVDIINRYINKG